MKPRRHDDEVMAAILSQRGTIERALWRLRVPPSAHPDLVQETVIRAWDAARRGRLDWQSPPALRVFLRLAAARVTYVWWLDNPQHVELHERDEPTMPSAESLVIARGLLRYLRESTTPERWRAIMANAKGISAPDIAKRERVPLDTVYTRIRLGREDIRAALARDTASVYVRRRR